ncbi:MAG: metallophosphoesterase family protein [Thermincola sp.]|jgi:putative phosphoesterase|nr:metallophosphoesterase family protein [Thermincola sp.]MDT3702404.1 metallophosphoesterase family protein [Thermincola sp.]
MKIAVISDIHANIGALEAVLEDIKGQSVDQVYCTGDLVGYAPYPNEVIELIKNSQIAAVMGNYDDAIGNMRLICGCDYQDDKAQALGAASITWTKEHTSEENKEFLRSLPAQIRFTVDKQRVLLVHGSPARLNEYIHEDTDLLEAVDHIVKGDTDILICGHTHKPYHRAICNKHIINAGSVGKPKHGSPEATYVILKFGPELEVEIRKVNYDYEAAAKAIEAAALPAEFAAMLRQGKGV